jgi:hypothetical protein
MLAKALALKVAAATIGLGAAAGGVALAATGGAAPTTGLGKGQAAAAGHPTGKPSKGAERPDAKGDGPSPSVVGLCRAFAAGAGDNPGKALENPAFTALITAAGGATEVPAFCADALAAKASAKPSAAPTGKADRPVKPEKSAKTRPTPEHPAPESPKGAPKTTAP